MLCVIICLCGYICLVQLGGSIQLESNTPARTKLCGLDNVMIMLCGPIGGSIQLESNTPTRYRFLGFNWEGAYPVARACDLIDDILMGTTLDRWARSARWLPYECCCLMYGY